MAQRRLLIRNKQKKTQTEQIQTEQQTEQKEKEEKKDTGNNTTKEQEKDRDREKGASVDGKSTDGTAKELDGVPKRDHFVFPSVSLITEIKDRRYTGAFRCLRREGGVLFVGGDDGVFVWNLASGALLHRIDTPRYYPDYPRVDAITVAGGIVMIALVPLNAPDLSSNIACEGGRVEVFAWETGKHLYTLYNGDWRPTGLSLRLPTLHDRKGERTVALLAAAFDDPMRRGRVKVWKYYVDLPSASPVSSSRDERCCSSCGESKPRLKFRRCACCHTAYYCNRQCQLHHWPRHQHLCTQRA